jgi:hypothetical protein
LPASETAAAERTDHPEGLGVLYGVHAQLACIRGDEQLAIDRAEGALVLLLPGDRFRSTALPALATIAARRTGISDGAITTHSMPIADNCRCKA